MEWRCLHRRHSLLGHVSALYTPLPSFRGTIKLDWQQNRIIWLPTSPANGIAEQYTPAASSAHPYDGGEDLYRRHRREPNGALYLKPSFCSNRSLLLLLIGVCADCEVRLGFCFPSAAFIGNMDGLHSDTIPAQIASGIPVSTLAAKYRRFVQNAAQRYGDFKKLNKFIEQRGQVEHKPNPSKTTLVEVVEGVADSDPVQYSSQITGDQKLAETLNGLCHVHAAGRLFIVENAGPDTMCLLGGAFDVDPQMFEEHLDTSPWYFLETIPDHLPQLQSVKRREQYVRLQFTAPRVYKPSKDPDDPLEFTCSDSRTAAIVRVGGKLIPRSRPGTKSFGKILLIRHSVAIWFGGPKFGARWNGRCCPFILRRTSANKNVRDYPCGPAILSES
jgi:hypothetical protein